MPTLKESLFAEFGGFADKRIKNLDKGNSFIVDDRGPADVGANRELKSYFCLMFATVASDSAVHVRLHGNVPLGERVKKWIQDHRAAYQGGEQPSLEFTVRQGEQEMLSELAVAVRSIVARGAPRYSVSSYKYVCPRTAGSLDRLKRVLDTVWGG